MDAIALQAPMSMGILQARILEWIGMLSSRGLSQPSDQTRVSVVQSLGWEDSLEKGNGIPLCILAWKIPWIEKTGRLQSMELQRVGHDSATKQQQQGTQLIRVGNDSENKQEEPANARISENQGCLGIYKECCLPLTQGELGCVHTSFLHSYRRSRNESSLNKCMNERMNEIR